MRQVQRAGEHLEQQRRHEEEVVPAHENDLDVGAAFTKRFEMAGRVDAAESRRQGSKCVSWVQRP